MLGSWSLFQSIECFLQLITFVLLNTLYFKSLSLNRINFVNQVTIEEC
jgi:hypothetical protein